MASIPKTRRWGAGAAGAGGLWTLYLGLAHFPLAYELPRTTAFANVPESGADLLILLSLAVGLLLLFIGGWSLWFAWRVLTGDRTARHFHLAVGLLYLGRTVVELLYPVSVPEPQPGVLLAVSLPALLFVAAAALTSARPQRQRTATSETS